MTFPAGAVPGDTVVTVRPMRASDVEGLYGTNLPSLEETRILGGFVAEFSIRQFDVPVVVAVPLRPPVDEGARLAHAGVSDSGDALKLSTTALAIDLRVTDREAVGDVLYDATGVRIRRVPFRARVCSRHSRPREFGGGNDEIAPHGLDERLLKRRA